MATGTQHETRKERERREARERRELKERQEREQAQSHETAGATPMSAEEQQRIMADPDLDATIEQMRADLNSTHARINEDVAQMLRDFQQELPKIAEQAAQAGKEHTAHEQGKQDGKQAAEHLKGEAKGFVSKVGSGLRSLLPGKVDSDVVKGAVWSNVATWGGAYALSQTFMPASDFLVDLFSQGGEEVMDSI